MMVMDDRELKRDDLRTLMYRMIRCEGSNGSTPRLGDLAQKMGLVSQSQIEKVLEEQASVEVNGRSKPMLGELLVNHGYLEADELSRVLAEQNRLAMSESEAALDGDEDLLEIDRQLKKLRDS